MNSKIRFWGVLIAIAMLSIVEVGGESSDDRELMLGVHVSAMDSILSSHLGLTLGIGLVVEYVDPESPAEKFEIRKHDVLTHFKDQALVNPAQFGVLIHESTKDEVIPIRYVRKGKRGTLSVRLSDREKILRVSDSYSSVQTVSDSLTSGRESEARSVSIITQDSTGSIRLVLMPNFSWISIRNNKDEKVHEGSFKIETDGAELPDEFEESLELIRSFEKEGPGGKRNSG